MLTFKEKCVINNEKSCTGMRITHTAVEYKTCVEYDVLLSESPLCMDHAESRQRVQISALPIALDSKFGFVVNE